MKRKIFSFLAGAGLIFAGAACERHSAAELEGGEGAKDEEPAAQKEAAPPEATPPAAAPNAEKPATPQAAPKFFPESK